MLLVALIVVIVAVALYWWRFGVLRSPRYRKGILVPATAMAALLVVAGVEQRSTGPLAEPVHVAIAVDVSLSMGTRPDPREHPDVGTRLERVQSVLLPLLADLDASAAPLMLAVTAFTSRSEIILSWDDDVPQIREVVEHVLNTDLLSAQGSNLAEALRGAAGLFELLPARTPASADDRYLILVSDGEQTSLDNDVATAAMQLRELDVKVIALYVGMSESAEGLPMWDAAGRFAGFEEVGGRIWSVPNPKTLQAIVTQDAAHGLFVDSAASGSVEALQDYLGMTASDATSRPRYLLLVLVLWALSMILLLSYS